MNPIGIGSFDSIGLARKLGRRSRLSVFERSFRWSALLILLFTAVAKLLSARGGAPLLAWADPILGISNRSLLVVVGLMELAVGVALLSGLSLRRKHLLLAWLSTNFLLYRAAFYALNPGKPCPCLGSLTEQLPIRPDLLNLLLSATVLYLLFGSASVLAIEYRWPDHRLK